MSDCRALCKRHLPETFKKVDPSKKMRDFSISIQFMITDQATKEKWVTPRHNYDKRYDDWHGDEGVKEQIIKDLEQALRNKFGRNCDIQIKNGKIVIVSQKFNEKTGEKSKISKVTDLRADDYFVRIMRFSVLFISKCITLHDRTILNIDIDREGNSVRVGILLEFPSP